jgi:hypothetical protein
MRISRAKGSVVASPLVNRLLELVEQSKRYQTEVKRVNAQIEQVKVKIQSLASHDERR